MKKEIGMRVGVLREATETAVYLYGFGTYEGERLPDESDTSDLASAIRAARLAVPVLKLDTGEVVYGFECWWEREETVRKLIAGRDVELVSIRLDREKFAKEAEANMASDAEAEDE